MPTYQEHEKFVNTKPYQAWYLILNADIQLDDYIPVGSIYLSKQREIGIFIFNEYKGQGYAEAACKQLIDKWPGKFLANVNPENIPSIELFKKLGFNQIQVTYALNSR